MIPKSSLKNPHNISPHPPLHFAQLRKKDASARDIHSVRPRLLIIILYNIKNIHTFSRPCGCFRKCANSPARNTAVIITHSKQSGYGGLLARKTDDGHQRSMSITEAAKNGRPYRLTRRVKMETIILFFHTNGYIYLHLNNDTNFVIPDTTKTPAVLSENVRRRSI